MTSRRACRFGAINETVLPPIEWLAHARRIEELGYATLLIRDHLLPDFFGPRLAPIPALMAAAGATMTLRVGTMVFANDFRHPAVLAKDLATLDLLSGGRLEIGIGAGWPRAEYVAAGLPYEPAGASRGWTRR